MQTATALVSIYILGQIQDDFWGGSIWINYHTYSMYKLSYLFYVFEQAWAV